jgi:catechol 2,3-dioxygenase
MPTKTGITGLRSVHMGLPDLDVATRYYTELWGLNAVAKTKESVFLRGTGADYYILALHRNPEPRLLRIDLAIQTRARADALRSSLEKSGIEVTPSGPIADPGGGYGFLFRDPVEGRVFRIIADAEQHLDCTDRADKPRKLSHIVLNSPDREAKFFTEQLGFKLIDQTKTITFLNCNPDHHSIALFISKDGSSFNHLAFEMQDMNSVMSATGNMIENGEEIGWGVGRHGPCDNVFCYFVGPGGFIVEYTSDVEQVDDTYKVGTPEDWRFRQGRSDQWGIAKRTARFHSAETKVPFSDVLFAR